MRADGYHSSWAQNAVSVKFVRKKSEALLPVLFAVGIAEEVIWSVGAKDILRSQDGTTWKVIPAPNEANDDLRCRRMGTNRIRLTPQAG